MSTRSSVIVLLVLLAIMVWFVLGPVLAHPALPSFAKFGSIGLSDRRLPNMYRLRPLEWSACRIKHGPEHAVLPLTGSRGDRHGILEVAIIGNVVVGPVVDMATPGRELVGWFWLDTRSQAFAEGLTRSELETFLEGRGLAFPPVLTHVNMLDQIPRGE